MPIYSENGPVRHEVGKLYDYTPTTQYPASKLYARENPTTHHLIYTAEEKLIPENEALPFVVYATGGYNVTGISATPVTTTAIRQPNGSYYFPTTTGGSYTGRLYMLPELLISPGFFSQVEVTWRYERTQAYNGTLYLALFSQPVPTVSNMISRFLATSNTSFNSATFELSTLTFTQAYLGIGVWQGRIETDSNGGFISKLHLL